MALQRYEISFWVLKNIFYDKHYNPEGQRNVSEYYLTIFQKDPNISKSEDNQSLPKKIPRCFDHTPTNLIEVNGKYWDQKWYPHMWDNFFYLLIMLPNNPLLYNEIAHRITELTNLLVHSIVRKDRKYLSLFLIIIIRKA